MLEVARGEPIGHLIEGYYRATAKVFSCRVGDYGSKESGMVQVRAVLNALRRICFNLEFDDEEISELVELERNLEECCASDKFEDAIAVLDDMDFITKQTVDK